MNVSTLDRGHSLVVWKRTPLNFINAKITAHEAELATLREKAKIAQRWDLEDRVWEVQWSRP